jgi:hypothetical protein
MLSDQRFVDLDTNLQYFAKKYDAVLARLDEERDDGECAREAIPPRRPIVRRIYSQAAGRGAHDGGGFSIARGVESACRQIGRFGP